MLTKELQYTNEHIKNHDKRISAIEKLPAKRWDLVVTAIITAAVSIVLGYFGGKL